MRSDDRRSRSGPRSGAGDQRAYDPPWRSVSEGRGLPRTSIYKAMLPVIVVASVGVLLLVVVLASLSALFD